MKKIDIINKEKLIKYFSNIRTSGFRILWLADNLHNLSRLEAGKMDFHIGLYDIKATLDLLKRETECILDEKQQTLNIIILTDSTQCFFDRDRIYLVINVSKFSGSREIIIEIKDTEYDLSHKYSNGLQISMIDLPEGELELIFNKFTQRSYNNRHSIGSGLGLAIYKKIINYHEGKIWTENVTTGGTKLSFILPKYSEHLH